MGYSVTNTPYSSKLYWNDSPPTGTTRAVVYEGMEFLTLDVEFMYHSCMVRIRATAIDHLTSTTINFPVVEVTRELLENFGFDAVNNITSPRDKTIQHLVEIIGNMGYWRDEAYKLGVNTPRRKNEVETLKVKLEEVQRQLEEKNMRIQELEEIIQDLKEDLDMSRALASEI